MSCLRKRDHHEDVNLRTSNEYDPSGQIRDLVCAELRLGWKALDESGPSVLRCSAAHD